MQDSFDMRNAAARRVWREAPATDAAIAHVATTIRNPQMAAMSPGKHRIAQPIGALERDAEDRSNTSDSCSGGKRYYHDA